MFSGTQSLTASAAETCDGFPRLAVESPPGFCLGIIATDFKFPRSIAALPNGDLFVVDMGGWNPNRGSVWRLTSAGKSFSRIQLFDKLDRPSHVAIGPDGWAYVGTPDAIFKFDPKNPAASRTAVIADLPTTGLHPLTVFAFDKTGSLYVNVGSESDNCEVAKGTTHCPEAEGRGVIRFYRFNAATGKFSAPEIYARGLRNSMAMTFVDERLFAAENSRDSIQKADTRLDGEELPLDEINLVQRSENYGWPYCYGAKIPSPEFPKFDCSKTTAPFASLPAHSAPLGMVYYQGQNFPEHYREKLIVALHGYKKYGHRIVAVSLDSRNSSDLISGWTSEKSGTKGAPVGLTVASDGTVLIADDKNKRILRLSFDPKLGAAAALKMLEPQIKPACPDRKGDLSLASQVQREVFDGLCFECHGKDSASAGRLTFVPCDYAANLKMLLAPGPEGEPWITKAAPHGPLYKRLNSAQSGMPPMPPSGLPAEKLQLIDSWLKTLK